MIACEFEPTDEPDHYRCRRPGCRWHTHAIRTRVLPIHARCTATRPPGAPKDQPAGPKRYAGLGSLIAAVLTRMGIRQCGGCKEREAALNRLVPFE